MRSALSSVPRSRLVAAVTACLALGVAAPAGARVAVVAGGPGAIVVDLERGAPRISVPLAARATSVAISADGRTAFAGAGSTVASFPPDSAARNRE